MTETHIGWIIMGLLVVGNLWIVVGLMLNLLRKLDKMEDKLMAMTEAYPHAAMIDMQKSAFSASVAAAQPPPLEKVPDWQTQEAS